MDGHVYHTITQHVMLGSFQIKKLFFEMSEQIPSREKWRLTQRTKTKRDLWHDQKASNSRDYATTL